jgi:osmotically-inducible protein OsmY
MQAFMEEEENLLEVDVETDDGVVYLTGETREPARKIRAEDIAKKIKGVKGVNNKISLEP